jgi:hypothetical protein
VEFCINSNKKRFRETIMQIRELSKPITAKKLNESLAKQFGYKLNLEQFSDAQLEDVRNKLRTEMSQFEVSESFDNISSNPKYQKTRALLDVINQHILEREEGMYEGAKPDFLDLDKDGNKKEAMKKAAKDKKKKMESVSLALMVKKAREHSVPTKWIESAISRIKLGESDEEELAAELTTRYDLSESQANYIVYLKEGEEQKASVIMATKDMVDQITGWLEDVAQLKAEHLLELLDSIRETLGSDVASKYEQSVKPALEQVYSALESSRQGLSAGLSVVSGGEAPTMGADTGGMPPVPGAEEAPAMGAEGGMPPMPGGEEEAPEMGAEAGGAGPEAAGRMKREGVEYSRKLGILLAQSKKK